MPDLTAQANELKQAPDQAIQQELQHPTGAVPSYLALSELQRRQLTRQAAQAQQSQGQSGSVYDDIVRAMMAKQPPQNLPAAPAGMAPMSNASPGAPGAAPQNFQAPPARMMARGGHFQDGGLDEEDDDEFSPEDPFLNAGANPFLQPQGGQAQGIAAVGAPQGMEASPDQFMQALGGGAGDVTEASPEDFLKALSAESLKGGHGGRKGGHGGKGGKGKGAGGAGGFKISKALSALGKMGGASHGIAAHPATIHFPHFSSMHPMQQHHPSGFHFAEGGMHFARGGASQIVDGTQVNPDGSTTYDWHDAAGNRHRTTMPPGFNVGRTTKGGSTRGGSGRVPLPKREVDPGVDRPGNDPDTGKPYKKGAWDRVWLSDPYTGKPVEGSEHYVHHKESAYANRPYGTGSLSLDQAIQDVTNGHPLIVGTSDGLRQVQNTPEDLDMLRKIGPNGFRYSVDRQTGLEIVTGTTPKETQRMVPGVDANGNPTLVPGGTSVTAPMGGLGAGAQPQVQPQVQPQAAPGGAMPTPGVAPAQVQPQVAPQVHGPDRTVPWELSEDAKTQNFPGGTQKQFDDFKARQKAAIPLREAASELLGNPDEKGFPGYIGMVDHMDDPVFVAHVGAALKRTLTSMDEGSKGASISADFGPAKVSTGDFGTVLSNYLGMPQQAIQSTLAINRQMIGSLTPEEQKAYRMGLAAITMSVGLKGLAPGSRSEAAMQQIRNEVPLIGVNAFHRNQFIEGFRPLTNEIKQGVGNAEKAGVSPGVLSVMKQGSDRIDNMLSGATIPRATIKAMADKWGTSPEELERRAGFAGFKVTDEPAASSDINSPALTLEQLTSGRQNPTTFSDWFGANKGKDQPPPPPAPLSPEQQRQLGVDAQGNPISTAAPAQEGPQSLGTSPAGRLLQKAMPEWGTTPIEDLGGNRNLEAPSTNPIVRWFEGPDWGRQNIAPEQQSWWQKALGLPATQPKPAPAPQAKPAPPVVATPQAPAPVAPPAVAPAQLSDEEIERRHEEIQRRRAEKEKAEQEKVQPAPAPVAAPAPPPPPQAAPSASEEKDTRPLPWEQWGQPQQQARGGQIFDRLPTRAETLRALTGR